MIKLIADANWKKTSIQLLCIASVLAATEKNLQLVLCFKHFTKEQLLVKDHNVDSVYHKLLILDQNMLQLFENVTWISFLDALCNNQNNNVHHFKRSLQKNWTQMSMSHSSDGLKVITVYNVTL